MHLNQLLQTAADDVRQVDPPRLILWCPPHGCAVICPPDLDQAMPGAQRFAGTKPGCVVAIYQLVGYTRAPIVEPEFTPVAEPAAAVAHEAGTGE